MFKTLILICHISISPIDCSEDNAVNVIRPGNNFNTPIECILGSRDILASTGLLDPEHYGKTVCTLGKKEEKAR